MIKLTRLNGQPIVVNPEIVEFLEATPDTVISFINGQKLAVRESPDEVIEKVVAYRRQIYPRLAVSSAGACRDSSPKPYQNDEGR